MNKKALTVIIGFIAIALGIGYTLAACGLIEPFSIFVPGWWTVFLIVPGLVMLFSRDSNKFVSLCLITIGVVLFLQKNDLLGDIKKYIIPALLIIFGLSLIIPAICGILIHRYVDCSRWIRLGLCIMVYVAIYSASVWFFSMNEYEKNLVAGGIRRIRKSRKQRG